jgi:ferrous iron transport protein B
MTMPGSGVLPPFTKHSPVVALVGNPNTGKTTLFNALSGLRQRVGNYPGVTVETKKGQMTCAGRAFDLIDLPGTYSLAPRSPDEMVAVDVILGRQAGEARPDVVVSLVDASNLERNLYLTTQVLELGVPVIIALNMIDVAEAQGLRIDAERLARQLGVPVVPIQANRRRGLDRLRQTIAEVVSASSTTHHSPLTTHQPSIFPDAFEREAARLHEAVGDEVPHFLVRRLLLDVGGYTEERLAGRNGSGLRQQVQEARQRLAAAGCPVPAVEARTRYAWIRRAVTGCIERPAQRPITWTDRIDRVLTHKLWGTLVFLAVMFVVFQSIFSWARPLMKLIDTGQSWLADLLAGWLPPGPLTSLLLDGVLKGVGSVVVFLPQILILFGFIAVLEDCGYMARAAFLMDKLMARCGLSGKSFIPLLSSVACAVPGIMATRVIENRRDRLATILVAPLMSCSARLPVYILLIGAFLTTGFAWWVPGVTMFCMYAIGLVAAPLVALLLKRTLLRGETPVFVMEMPLYKWPSPRTVLGRMLDAGWEFLRRAGTLILASMVLVWALLYFPRAEPDGQMYDLHYAQLKQKLDDVQGQTKAAEGEAKEKLLEEAEAKEKECAQLNGDWKKQSWLGRMGHAIEPAVRPLGWDWRLGMAALASFPAREVVVGTLGIIYNVGDVDPDEVRDNPGETALGQELRGARWDDDPNRPVFTLPAVLSLMVFFALCCQCVSTLAVIRRETGTWRWPAFTFVYMTVLAYVGALVVYQVGSWFV